MLDHVIPHGRSTMSPKKWPEQWSRGPYRCMSGINNTVPVSFTSPSFASRSFASRFASLPLPWWRQQNQRKKLPARQRTWANFSLRNVQAQTPAHLCSSALRSLSSCSFPGGTFKQQPMWGTNEIQALKTTGSGCKSSCQLCNWVRKGRVFNAALKIKIKAMNIWRVATPNFHTCTPTSTLGWLERKSWKNHPGNPDVNRWLDWSKGQIYRKRSASSTVSSSCRLENVFWLDWKLDVRGQYKSNSRPFSGGTWSQTLGHKMFKQTLPHKGLQCGACFRWLITPKNCNYSKEKRREGKCWRQVVQKSKIYTLQMPFSEAFEDLMGR